MTKKTGLRALAGVPGKDYGGQPLKLTKIRDALSGDDQKWLDEALADQVNWSARRIARALVAYGYPVSDSAVISYREKML